MKRQESHCCTPSCSRGSTSRVTVRVVAAKMPCTYKGRWARRGFVSWLSANVVGFALSRRASTSDELLDTSMHTTSQHSPRAEIVWHDCLSETNMTRVAQIVACGTSQHIQLRLHANASKCIQTHQSASKRIQCQQIASKRIRLHPKGQRRAL